MQSPFPGMDPFLEVSGDWRDFHASFISASRDAIAERLPPGYVARIDERFRLMELPEGPARGGYPDVSLVRHAGRPPGPPGGPGGAVTMEPVPLRLRVAPPEQVRETWIEIRHQPGWTLVTSIELLSPTNKAEPGRADDLAKRVSLLREPVHLVEIDLLVGGARLPMDDPLPPGDYFAFVARAERRPVCDAYAWSVRRPLPTIPIPLHAPDPDVPLDLAAIFALTYRRARYERTIDYAAPLPLPLATEDRAWAEELARSTRGEPAS